MATHGERLSSIETAIELSSHSTVELCKELEADRKDRKERDAELHVTLYGKGIQKPGLIGEVRLLKGFRSRVLWIGGVIAAAAVASVSSLVAWLLGLIGGRE